MEMCLRDNFVPRCVSVVSRLWQYLSCVVTSGSVDACFVVLSASLFELDFQSGKLVGKMFEQIRHLLADSECLVFVLIDEVMKCCCYSPFCIFHL